MTKTHSTRQPGFTIVELLIVVVVIAILAAITIVSYNGIQTRAKISSLQSDLRNAATKVTNDFTINNSLYPTSLAAVNNNEGVKASNGTTFSYVVDNNSDPKSFCITATNGTLNYFVNQTNKIAEGTCSGGEVSESTIPTMTSYTKKYGTVGLNTTITPSSTIIDGSWMIVAFVYTGSNSTINPPSGWSVIVPTQHTSTMQFILFAKIKTSSDPTSYTFTSGLDQSVASSTIMWGSGSSPVANWVVGNVGLRESSGTGTTNVAPPVSAPAKSLILTISPERTVASETNVSSLTNTTPWFFMAQGSEASADVNIHQSILVGYTTTDTGTTTSPVTIAYPNTHFSNGLGVQIAIPATTP
jgi:prepilin-type N-terminal cleavage/methylation domain-containing protein